MIQPPVEPAQKLLPLNDEGFEWDDFEEFCAEFVSQLPFVIHCHRYGKKGDKQEGIDIIADLEDGRKAVFSCKQYNEFKKGDAEKAVRAMTYKADDCYLLLSCEASISARDTWCNSGPNWRVWDTYDIAKEIRKLPLDETRRLIMTYFGPIWVKAFLGIEGISAFVSPKEYFAKLMNPDNLFSHIYPLVGRKDLLEQLHRFVESEKYSIAIIAGRGGVGKTKILQSFSENFSKLHKDKALFFVNDGVPISQESANDLPLGPCIIVIDDAHRSQDLSILFAIARKRSIKLLLSFRPYALESINSHLISAKFDVNEIRDFGIIKDMDNKEIKDLASQVLGQENANFVDQLVAVGRDSPLVIVVGGRLIREKKVNPNLFVLRSDFKRAVLEKFQEFLLGKVSERIEPKLCRNILYLVAAISPIRINDIKDEAAAFLGIEAHDLIHDVNILERAGILLIRGYTLRIVPDVLSDHILYEACITPEGKTGYAQKVFENLKMVCSGNILNNLAELDWRARRSGDTQIDLLADIWASISEDFQNASNLGRWTLLNKLEHVAYLQPERMLSLVEFAIRNPSNIIDDKEFRKYTHDDVMQELPVILKNMSHNIEYLSRCCDLLWKMGSNDRRDLNRYPNHPIRILKELSGYDINKPYNFNKIVLDTVTTWLKAPDIHNHFHSIFDVLEPLLAKSGNSVHMEGIKMVFTPFLVDKNDVQPIREKVLNLIENNINKDNTKVRLKAIKCLGNAITEPFKFNGLDISEDVFDQWVPEQLQVLEILRRLADCVKDPLVHIEIINAISWEAHKGRSKEVKERAQEIIDSIKETFEFRLTRVLKNSYLHENLYQRHKDHRKWVEEENCDLANEFLEKYPDPCLGFINLNQRLLKIKNNGIEPQPEQFLVRISYINQEYAESLCKLIIKDPNCSIAPFFHNILYEIRYKDISRSSDLVLRAINTGNLILCRSAAYIYLIWKRCPILQCDFENIKKLLTHQDLAVKMNAIRSLGVMAHLERQIGTDMDFNAYICDENEGSKNSKIAFSVLTNIRKISVDSLNILALSEKRIGIDIALDVDIGDDTELADILCSIFDEKRGIPIGDLTDEQLNFLVKKFELVKDIDRYHISEMLRNASVRIPHSIVHLFLNRIRFDRNYSENYRPLPYLGFHENIFINSSNSIIYKDILKEIRSFALEYKNNFWISILFKDISGNFSDMSLEVLNEWVSTDDANKIMSVGDLLRHASSDFIFSHTDFISNLLEHSYYAGNECYNYIKHILSNIAISGGSSRTPGEPSPKEVDTRDRASEALKQFDVGSPTYKFYDSLRKEAELSITHDLKWDEEILD